MAKEIPKAYDPQAVEDKVYSQWEKSGFFNPDNLPGDRRETFTIMMPPPNVTGILHLGHALENALMDIEIRYQRMLGKKALLLPGVDHAAIATQAKVEKNLIKEGIKNPREHYGREKLVEIIREQSDKSKDTIVSQIKKMGTSCDWSRFTYTFDDKRSNAVNTLFKKMYNDGLIYRGHRIVNWDPKLHTTVSDDEIVYVERQTKFYYFKYGPFEIGTARPETKFGDKYVLMHPEDKRYEKYQHGQQIEVEWINGPITATIIKDEVVDMEFGTGVMTITPWHSVVDFELAEKYKLDKKQIIDFNGNLLPIAQEFAGMPIEEAREKIVEKLQKKGLVSRIDENYINKVATNDRGGAILEPQIKEQWFVNVSKEIPNKGKSLRDLMRDAVTVGHNNDSKQIIKVYPERFLKPYIDRVDNLYDWNISRQIWWGHRIPVWYKGEEIFVGADCPGDGWIQDEDTLDTWFSSGAWTFSTLGWPNDDQDLKTYHPTSFMQMGYEILYLWMMRMVLTSTYAMDEIPFHDVYIHGMLRDKDGRKFSKSLDNGIDPIDVISQYGTDALRLSLIKGITPGNDARFYNEKIEGARNFINKLWNISRYILTSVDEALLIKDKPRANSLADEWILDKLEEVISKVTDQLNQYQFSLAIEILHDFTWSDFADWYIELAKIEKDKEDILLYVLQNLLKLWHPFTPFVTESIWSMFDTNSLLMVQDWPKTEESNYKIDSISQFNLIKEIVTAIRAAKAEAGVAPSLKIAGTIIAKQSRELLENQKEIIASLARLSEIKIVETADRPENAVFAVVSGIEIYLLLSDTIDIDKQKAKLNKEIAGLIKYINSQQQKLANKQFVQNAPTEIVESEQAKLTEAEDKVKALQSQFDLL